MTTPVDRGRCRQNVDGLCDSSCLCQLFNTDALVSTDTLSLEIDEIYQVLGRDILKSSLLDDIDLYLECDEDSLYVVPQEVHPSNSSQEASSRSTARVRISFPSSCQSDTQERFRCTQCTRSFTRESLLKDHRFRCHGIRNLFPCSMCSYVGHRHRLLQKHTTRQHPKHSHQEPELNVKQQLQQTDQQSPLSKMRSVLQKQCNMSKSKAGSAADATNISCTSLNMCLNSDRLNEPVVCGARPHDTIHNLSNSDDKCATSEATDNSYMSKHCNAADAGIGVAYTTEQPKPKCAEVAKSAKHGGEVSLFANEETSDIVCKRTSTERKDVFRCDRCSKVFKQRRSYDNHMKKHSGILPYNCMECDKQFASKDTLGKHIKTHQNITRLECLHMGCEKTFKTRFALKEHMTVVHGTKTWLCAHSGCEKAYATQKDLRSHAIAHTSKHKCDECGKTFRDHYNLAMHQDTHSGVKNEACPLCDYRCVQKNSLNGHMRKRHPNCEIHTAQ